MSNKTMRNGRIALVVVGMIVAGPSFAQQRGSRLDEAARRQAVAVQKLESDVHYGMLAASRATTKDKAVTILQGTLRRIDSNTAAPDEVRNRLRTSVERRIKAYEAGPDKETLNQGQIDSAIRKYEDKLLSEKKQAEGKKLQEMLTDLQKLQSKGKIEDARRLSQQIAREFPSNPAAVAAFRTQSAMDQLASARQIRYDSNRGFVGAMNEVDKSAIPIKGDVEFGPRWKEISAYRLKKYGRNGVGLKLNSREQAIVTALNSSVTVNFKGEKFQEVIEYLATLVGQPILVDKQAATDAGIDYDSPINLSVRGVTLRTLLRKILGDYSLTYIVKDQTIQVVSLAKARETMLTRAYPVGDLLGNGGGPGDPLTGIYGPGIGQIQRMQNVANLISMLQTTVDPSSWSANGGPGAIYFDFATMALVVRNSAEVHAMIGGGFLR